MTRRTGFALCGWCEKVWFATDYRGEGRFLETCRDCGGPLKAVTEEPFGPGTLHVPPSWVAAKPPR